MEDSKIIKRKEIIIILLCWLVYTTAYLGKYSYSTNIVVITEFFNASKSEAGLVSTIFFIAYGIGQIVNGILCRRYNKRLSISLSLLISGLCNLSLFFNIPFESIKYIWLLNGISQSILWPTLIETIGTYIGSRRLKSAVVAMSTTIAVGTILAYLTSALFVQFSFFKYTFLLTAIALILVSISWFIGFHFAIGGLTPQSRIKIVDEKSKENSKATINSSFLILLISLMIFAVINNFIKDGLNTWVPNILKDMFNFDDSASIILTVSLSLLGIFGTVFATFLNKYIRNMGLLSGLFFSIAAVLILGVIFLLDTKYWVLVIIFFSLISLLMNAINNIITSMFPLYMQKKGNAGFLSGILNGACYLGSALSAYGLGAYADIFGWSAVFKLLFICSLVPIVISGGLWLMMYFDRRKN